MVFLGSTAADHEEKQKKLQNSLAKLNNLLLTQDTINEKNGKAGPYLLGSKFSFAEIFFIGFIERMSVLLAHYHNFEVFSGPEGELTRLKQWWSASRERPAFQKTLEGTDREFWINLYKGHV